MSLPAPRTGLVIRYGFLWSDEADAGAEEGAKDRPCAIVVATKRATTGGVDVIVAPITHAKPAEDDSLAIPPAVARTLGLDGERHWIRVDELNRFAWPGYDFRSIPGRPGQYDYGMLPDDLYQTLRRAILERQVRIRPRMAPRLSIARATGKEGLRSARR